MGTRVITMKLTATEVLAIETIMESGKYDSRSSLLRAGLGAIFDRHKLDKSFDRQIESERSIHAPRATRVKRKLDLSSGEIPSDEAYKFLKLDETGKLPVVPKNRKNRKKPK